MSRDRYAIILNKPIPDHTPPAIEENEINEQELTAKIKLLRPKTGDMIFVQLQSPVTSAKLHDIYDIISNVNNGEFPREHIFTMVFNGPEPELNINLISEEELKKMGLQRINKKE